MGDGLTIELGKNESPEVRGYIQATGQLVRFAMLAFTCFLGMVFMNGESYVGANKNAASSFEIPFNLMPVVLLVCATPFYLLMCMWLEDVPESADSQAEHRNCASAIVALWEVFCGKAMLFIIILSLGIVGIGQLPNPALNAVTEVVEPTTMWNSLGMLVGHILFIVGVWIFRTYFLTTNWRITMAWTTLLFAICYAITYMTIGNVGGFGQSQWFFVLGPSGTLSNLVLGIQQVVTGLSIIEIAPKGMEATTYETYTMVVNGAMTFSYSISNTFLGVFNLNDITYDSYHRANTTIRDKMNEDMRNATTMTMIVTFVSIATFVWFQPPSAEVVRCWNRQWNHPATGIAGLVLSISCFVYGTIVSVAQVVNADTCRIVLGGDGCQS